jgi:hypothetical protein
MGLLREALASWVPARRQGILGTRPSKNLDPVRGGRREDEQEGDGQGGQTHEEEAHP